MFIRCLIILAISVITNSSFAQGRGVVCDDCSAFQKRSAAATTAGSAANFGVLVYVFDFPDREITRYFVSRGTLNPVQQENFLNSLSGDTKILSEQEVETRSGSLRVVEIQVSQELQEGFTDVALFVEYLEANGASPRRRNVTRQNSDGATVNNAFNVPSGIGFDSAFDVIDFSAFTREIGRLGFQNNINIGRGARAAEVLSDFVPILGDFVNLEARYEFIFSDGSRALWAFDEFNGLDAIPGTFRDGEGNDIPESGDELNGESFGFRGAGLPDNNDSMNGMIDRIQIRFGVPVRPQSPGGGSGGGSVCTITCSNDGDGVPMVCFRSCN